MKMSQSFLVTIPEGVKPGDTFQTLLMDKHMVPITCPDNAPPGTILQVNAKYDPENDIVCIEETAIGSDVDVIQQRDYCTMVWVFVDMLLLVLFTLSCTLAAFAIQQIRYFFYGHASFSIINLITFFTLFDSVLDVQ